MAHYRQATDKEGKEKQDKDVVNESPNTTDSRMKCVKGVDELVLIAEAKEDTLYLVGITVLKILPSSLNHKSLCL